MAAGENQPSQNYVLRENDLGNFESKREAAFPMRGYLRIDLANNCNIRCIMCQAYNSMSRSSISFLDFDLFVRQTKGHLKQWQVIQLGNTAEATIHPKFGDFLRYIRSESDAITHVVTNGKLLVRYAKLINELGNCLVQVSLDSLNKETHEYIREGSDYNKAMDGLRLLDTSRTRVLLSFTLMKSNIAEYPEMVNFCKQHGYEMSVFPLIVREENAIIPYNLLEESLWFNLNSLKAWLREYYGKAYEGIVTGAAPGTTNLGISEFSCNAHKEDFGIDAAGNATLCFKLATGSLSHHSLEELWNCGEAVRFRNIVELDRSPCIDCDYRKRCLAPSMVHFDNHFGESICSAISPACKNAINYNRSITDDEARELFIRDLGLTKFGIFRIAQAGSKFSAERLLIVEPAGSSHATVREIDRLEADSRQVLHQKMVETTGSVFNVKLLEQYGDYNLVSYLGQYWAFPLVLGFLNPTRDEDRRKPGVLAAVTLPELKKKCDEEKSCLIPTLIRSEGAYNIVSYLGKFWAVPLSLGPVFLNLEEERQRIGVMYADTLEEIVRRIRAVMSSKLLSKDSPHVRDQLFDRGKGDLIGEMQIRSLVYKRLLTITFKQLWSKAIKSERRGKSWNYLIRRAYYFGRNMWRFNSYVVEQSKHCLNELAANGIKEVAIYGADEIAEILNDLSFKTSVKIEAIYDEVEANTSAGLPVRSIDQYQGTPEKIIVASILGVEDKIERLKSHGVPSENIIVLQ